MTRCRFCSTTSRWSMMATPPIWPCAGLATQHLTILEARFQPLTFTLSYSFIPQLWRGELTQHSLLPDERQQPRFQVAVADALHPERQAKRIRGPFRSRHQIGIVGLRQVHDLRVI